MVAATLEVLLIEDNPGDARLVEEMLREVQPLLHRIEVDGATPEEITFNHESDLAGGLDHLSRTDVDIVLLDLGLPTSTGLDTLTRVVEYTEFTPIVVLTGLDDRDRGIQAIQSGAQDYLVKDDVNGELLTHSIQYAITQIQQERERVRHREQLEALNELNTITQEITHDLITSSSREDLERAVCERLADSYGTAWIGDVGRRTSALSPRVVAGEHGFFDDFTIAVDGSDPERPEAKAARTRDVQVVGDIQTDPELEHMHSHAGENTYNSVAAVPITYQTVFYGVLAIYAESPTVFSDRETAILSRLGDVIGHAITSIERKNALVSDKALELEFRIEGMAEKLVALTASHECGLHFENIIRTDNGLLVYGRAEEIQRDVFRATAEDSKAIENLRLLSNGQDCYEFEFHTGAINSLDTAMASHGGRVTSAVVSDGELRIVVEFPQGRDKRRLVELTRDTCPSATLQAHRTVERENPSLPDSRRVFQNRLSEKQRAALKTAFHAGYFEWPRTTTGDEVADLLGVSQATFSQHFRAAEREFFSAVFETTDGEEPPVSSPWTNSATADK